MGKKRLDILLVERGLVESREKAKALVLAGDVLVDGQAIGQPSCVVADDAHVSLKRGIPYVSRGGLKLEHALREFRLDVAGLVVLDVGASTGGFTDCLLQHRARRVYAVDVGYGQLAWKLRGDQRVVVLDRTNIRYLEDLPEHADAAVADVSFISLKLVLPRIARLTKPGGWIVALIKPQFEAGRGQVGKGGVVREAGVHRQVLSDVLRWAVSNGFAVAGLRKSPVIGPAGNKEFLALLRKTDDESHERQAACQEIEVMVETALSEA